jgi:hypothetical protein
MMQALGAGSNRRRRYRLCDGPAFEAPRAKVSLYNPAGELRLVHLLR